ncbi:MAG TPA: papain-like cysteine protease family protein [Candidatus Xenobia bacterium]|jgi:hypothetical protein
MEGLQSALSRIEQIQSTITQETQSLAAPGFDQALQQAMAPPAAAAAVPPQMASNFVPGQSMSPELMMMMQNTQSVVNALPPLTVNPLAQSNSISCGQTSVAMAVNALTGKNLRDTDINARYGFGLLNALNGETNGKGFQWRDAGELNPTAWATIDQKVNQEHTPVIVGLNGPEFSPSGHGHIVTIIHTDGENVTYADPATGTVKTTTKNAMNTAPPHPDGKFLFVCDRAAAAPQPPPVNNWLAGMMPPEAPQTPDGF